MKLSLSKVALALLLSLSASTGALAFNRPKAHTMKQVMAKPGKPGKAVKHSAAWYKKHPEHSPAWYMKHAGHDSAWQKQHPK